MQDLPGLHLQSCFFRCTRDSAIPLGAQDGKLLVHAPDELFMNTKDYIYMPACAARRSWIQLAPRRRVYRHAMNVHSFGSHFE